MGLWFGAVAGFSAFRGLTFETLASRHTAELVLIAGHHWVDKIAIIISPFAIATLMMGWRRRGGPFGRRFWTIVIGAFLAIVSAQWVTSQKYEIMWALGQRLEDADPSSPLVLKLAQLDQIGVFLLVVHGTLAALVIVASVFEARYSDQSGIHL